MSANVSTVVSLEKTFVALSAGLPPVFQASKAPISGNFLSIVHASKSGVPARACFVLSLAGDVCVYKVGRLREVRLRNLRCHDAFTCGDRFVFCASCGFNNWFADGDILEARWERCPMCKAAASVNLCPCYHAFGACSRCRMDLADDCPFERTASRSEVDAAAHAA